MTDKQLDYILTIAQEKNITRAAGKLMISQSSLSQLLSHVEQELGAELFSRDTQPLVPTYAGKLFLKSAQEILEIKHNLLSKYAELKNERAGRIHIGMSQDRSWLFTPLIIPNYIKQFPNVEIIFTEANQKELTEMLIQGKLDLIFTIDPPILNELSYQTLFSEQMLLILPSNSPICKELDGNSVQALHSLESIPFILTRHGNNLRELADRILGDLKISPRVLLESQSMDVCFRMSACGVGASIVPDTIYYFRESRGHVYALPLDEKYNRDIAIAYRKNMYISFILAEFIRVAAENLLLARRFHSRSGASLASLFTPETEV